MDEAVDDGFTDIHSSQDLEDIWQQTDVIRTHLREHLNQLLFVMARLNRSLADFERQFGPSQNQLSASALLMLDDSEMSMQEGEPSGQQVVAAGITEENARNTQ